jgi:hypothetical protein
MRGALRPSREIFIYALLVIATLCAYFPILTFDFVGLDDQVTVFQNWNLIHLSPSTFYSFWTEPQGQLYTPLTYSLFAAISLGARVKAKAGEVPAVAFYAGPFHAVDLALHLLSVIVVYRLLRRMIGPHWPAAAGALLFALHPVQVESVAWVTATNGLLCGFLSLLAVLLYLRATSSDRRTKRWPIQWSGYALATEVFILALLAKPAAVIVPLLAWIAHWLMSRQQPADSDVKRNPDEAPGPHRSVALFRRALPLIIWLFLSVPFAIVARVVQPIPDWWLVVPIWQRPFVAADALAFYIYKILWPRTLTVDYGRAPALIFSHGWAWYTWIVPATLGAVIVAFHRKRAARHLIAGSIWFLAALLPVLGFTRFAFERFSTVSDRYLYVPMFGVALAVAWGLNCLVNWNAARDARSARIGRLGIIAACIVILALLGTRTFLQTQYWRNKRTLFQHSQEVIHRTPGTPQDN